MITPNYTLQTSFLSGPKPSENTSDADNHTPTTPSSLSDSPFLNSRKSAFECEQLLNEKEAMKKQIELSNNELYDLKNKLLQAARQKQALNQAHVKITELESKVSELTEENSKLKVEAQKNEESVQSSQKYQAILQQNISEIRMLSSKLVEAEKGIRHFQQENTQIKLKLDKVLNALNASEENKEDLWATIEQQEKQIDQLQKTLQTQKTTYIQALEDLKINLTELTSKNQELCETLQAQANEITQLKNQSYEIAQTKKDIRLLKLQNNQLQALLKEKCHELDLFKQDQPSLRLESERSAIDRFGPSTPSASTSCSRSLTAVSNSTSGKVKFVRMKKVSKTQGNDPNATRDIEKKILTIMTERGHLTKKNDELIERIKDQKKNIDQLHYFTKILNTPKSARERQVYVSRLPIEWEEKNQAPFTPFSRLLKSREITQEELRRKNKSAAMFEKGTFPIHAL